MKPQLVATMVLGLAVAWTAAAVAQQTAEQRFQAGLYQEEVQGNLQQAIAIYEGILEEYAANRVVAAKAQLHIGICYETLGLQEAQRAYQRVVDGYGDQTEVVSQARTRLAALQGLARTQLENEPTGPVARMLFKADWICDMSGMRPSPDGNRLAYSADCGAREGAVYVQDLRSGQTRRVAVEGYHMGAVWSPDGSHLAVADLNAGVNGSRSPLKIIDLESGAVEMPTGLEEMWFVHDWSPDGDRLAGELNEDEVVVSLKTGEVITLASRPKRYIRPDFSPDGRYVAYTDFVDDNADIWVMALETRERHRVTSDPGAERSPQWSPDGETIAYVAQGDLWGIRMANGRPEGQPFLVKRGGGPLVEWTEHGAYYENTNRIVVTYRIPLDPATAQVTGPPERMRQLDGYGGRWLAWSPDMRQIATAGAGYMTLIRDGTVTALPIGDIRQVPTLWWSRDGSEILFTRRTWGYSDKRQTVFGLNPVDGRLRELFPRQDSIFHIHVSPDGGRMVFLRGPGTTGGLNELVVSDLGNFNGRVLASESDPEGQFSLHYGQPVFSPDGSQIAFVRQDRSLGSRKPVSLYVVPSDGSAPPRLITTAPLMVRITWDPSGRFIAFMELDTVQETRRVMVVSVETGVKHEIGPNSDASGSLRLKAWSPDGRWIAFSRATGGSEYWVTDDLLGERRM
jgi:Tol biopolymer transport system component